MSNKKNSRRQRRPRDEKETVDSEPGREDDGGESILSGRSREHHPGVPEEVELPPARDDDASQ